MIDVTLPWNLLYYGFCATNDPVQVSTGNLGNVFAVKMLLGSQLGWWHQGGRLQRFADQGYIGAGNGDFLIDSRNCYLNSPNIVIFDHDLQPFKLAFTPRQWIVNYTLQVWALSA
jgi:hypothetical protein